jgi:hypothetical protein
MRHSNKVKVMTGVDERQQQRLEALQAANGVRLPRAQLHRDAREGLCDVAALIFDPPAAILSAQIGTIVEWKPGVGRWRAKQILSGLARSETLVDHLSASTREQIASRMRGGRHDGPH